MSGISGSTGAASWGSSGFAEAGAGTPFIPGMSAMGGAVGATAVGAGIFIPGMEAMSEAGFGLALAAGLAGAFAAGIFIHGIDGSIAWA